MGAVDVRPEPGVGGRLDIRVGGRHAQRSRAATDLGLDGDRGSAVNVHAAAGGVDLRRTGDVGLEKRIVHCRRIGEAVGAEQSHGDRQNLRRDLELFAGRVFRGNLDAAAGHRRHVVVGTVDVGLELGPACRRGRERGHRSDETAGTAAGIRVGLEAAARRDIDMTACGDVCAIGEKSMRQRIGARARVDVAETYAADTGADRRRLAGAGDLIGDRHLDGLVDASAWFEPGAGLRRRERTRVRRGAVDDADRHRDRIGQLVDVVLVLNRHIAIGVERRTAGAERVEERIGLHVTQ